jgi:hypothetical protein
MKGQDECTIDNIIIQGFIEDIIVQNKVDIVFQAHLHNYERLTPILYNKTMSSSEDTLNYYKNPSAPVYLVVGNAGNYEGTNDPISMHPQDYSVYRTTEFGYGIFKVFNATHLHWSLYGSKHGEMLDYVWIEKDS